MYQHFNFFFSLIWRGFQQIIPIPVWYCHVFVSSFYLFIFFAASLHNHKFLTHICAMLEKLKQRWKVNGVNLVLIIATFASGGSLCGYAGRKILLFTNLEKGVLWFVLYILLITLLWPLCVLIISIPLGQFTFFKKYIVKVWKKMSGRKDNITNQEHITQMAVFASGAGSNAGQIINHFATSPTIKVALVVCNKPGAGVLQIAAKAGIPSLLIEKERFFKGDGYLPELKKYHIDFIVLAGFLWKMPVSLLNVYPKKIVNIHPALLPKYGGKGMYGQAVHEAVIAAGDNESGITIHFVDELYDHGAIIFQVKCEVAPHDTAETLAQKIHVLEHANYPDVIASVLKK
jgi:formyltetrahydrofolate-dependent phosphoribosylglycinamide formyltransferase